MKKDEQPVFFCIFRFAVTLSAVWLTVAPLGLRAADPAAAGESTRRLPAPAVWIFAGLPGDPERETRYLATVDAMKQALVANFGIPAGRVTVLFGAGQPSTYAPCTRKNLFRELAAVCAGSAKGVPAWLFFIGHANSTKPAVFFNLPGQDVRAGEIAARLASMNRDCPAVFWLTTAASGRFIGPLARRGRVLIAAVPPGREDNETEMPHVLAAVLAAPETADADDNGSLSLVELAREVRRRTAAWYADEELVPTEELVLDGNGDGKARSLPCPEEETPAAASGLVLRRSAR
jgi:hypothetical protein